MFGRRPVSLIKSAAIVVVLAIGVVWAWSAWFGSPTHWTSYGDANPYVPTSAEFAALSMEAESHGLDSTMLASDCFDLDAHGLDPRLKGEAFIRWCWLSDEVAELVLPVRPLPSEEWILGLVCEPVWSGTEERLSPRLQCTGQVENTQGLRGMLGFAKLRSISVILNDNGSFVYSWIVT